MVQMKEELMRLGKTAQLDLYIPHGSDERAFLIVLFAQSQPFISHMVQMKGQIRMALKVWRAYFISHMVQMKAKVQC